MGLVAQIFHSVLDYVAASDAACKVHLAEIDDGMQLELPRPKTIHPTLDHYFMAMAKVRLGPSHVFSVPECTVFDGVFVSADACLVTGLGAVLGDRAKTHPQSYTAKPATTIAGSVALITGRWPRNYYHWMVEIVPKFRLLAQSALPIDKYVLSCHRHFHSQVVEQLQIPAEKIVAVGNRAPIRVRQLLVPETHQNLRVVSPHAAGYLRDLFPDSSTRPGAERLYVSRGSARRHVVNEEELMRALCGYGFQRVVLDTLSVWEQARLFSSAEVVLAPHGAGLTNLVFCRPGTKVIELFAPEYVHGVFWQISCHVGLDYYYVVGEGDVSKKIRDLSKNVEIDVDKVAATLRHAQIKEG